MFLKVHNFCEGGHCYRFYGHKKEISMPLFQEHVLLFSLVIKV